MLNVDRYVFWSKVEWYGEIVGKKIQNQIATAIS